MITVEPVDDMRLVNRIIKLPEIWDRLSDGLSRFEYQPENTDTDQWLLVQMDGVHIGVILASSITSCTIEVHPALKKKYRRYCREMMNVFYQYVIKSLPACKKITAIIPECFKTNINAAIKAGFVKEGVNRMSYERFGILYDQIHFGITLEEAKR